MVKISIIIPSFNQGQFIEDTIVSVINQHYENLEILVMDGGSTDNTVDILKKYDHVITYWQSKKDRGQSDAINQGARLATGEIITWLNSDDVLLPGVLAEVNRLASAHPDVQWFLGNVLWMNKEGRIIRVGRVERESSFWNKRQLFSNGGPSAFMRRECYLKIGALNEDFHYMMDTEFWHRYLSLGYGFIRINKYCWGLRLHENAKMSGHNFKNSKLADKSHPSWIQKEKESSYIASHYPKSKSLMRLWSFFRLFGVVTISRLTDRGLLGKSYLQYR